jgi:hypothetical protein
VTHFRPGDKFITVHYRHVQVGQDKIKRGGSRDFFRFLSVAGNDDEAILQALVEYFNKLHAKNLIIIDKEGCLHALLFIARSLPENTNQKDLLF